MSGENVFFCATGVTDGDLLKGVRYYRRRLHHPVDRDALEVGHRPDDRGLPPAVQAQRILRDRLHRRQQRRIPTAVTTTQARHMTLTATVDTDGRRRIPHRARHHGRGPGAGKALWRAQTQRAVENFPISGRGLERTQIRALGLLKGACAQVNKDLGLLAAGQGRRDHRRRRRDRRRPARRPVPDRRLPDRVGHQLQHEHQRGDREHRRRQRRDRASQRRRQHVAVVQRHLPDRHPHRGHRSRCAPSDSGARGAARRRWPARPAHGTPWSSRAART